MTRNHRKHRDDRRAAARSFFEPLEGRQLMSGGELDRSFSWDGVNFVFPGNGIRYTASDVAVQADGKTVVTGTSTAQYVTQFLTARFNPDGSPDKTFGPRSDGLVYTQAGGKRSSASAVAIQADGKIVVVGTRYGDDDDFAVVRYNTDGSLDKTFDGDGKKTIRVKESSSAYDVAIQRDGKIVIVGSDYNGRPTATLGDTSNNDFAAVRLNPNGSLDSTFGFLGKTVVAMGSDEWAHAVAIDYTGTAATNPHFGKIVLAGTYFDDGVNSMALSRLHPNGRRDMSFDRVQGLHDNGYNIDTFPGRRHSGINGVVVQPDGKIVVAGYAGDTFTGGSNQFALSRYDANGKRDKSFGPSGNGVVETGFGGADFAYGVVQMPDGGLVAGGSVNGNFAMAAYDANGRPNTAFGTGGKAKLVFGKGAGRIAIGPNGTLMLAGGDIFTTARVLGPRPNVQISSVRSTSEGAGESGSVSVTREGPTTSPLRVYLNVGGAAKLNQDYTSNLRQNAKAKTTAGTKVAKIGGGVVNMIGAGFASGTGGAVMNVIGGAGGKVIGGGVKDVVSGAGLHEITSNRSLPFIDIPAGQASATVSLSAIQDSLLEPTESATFTLAADADYSIGERKQATVSIADDDELRVNFQTFNRFPPVGYAADLGDVFGDRGAGMSFGWDADNIANARSRNSAGSPDARYDTYNHMQKNGANRRWEIALPNGLYTVRLVAGDADATDSVHRMNLEGQLALAGTPSGDVRWFRSTVNVLVSDGRLTLTNAPGAQNNKIAFIDIKAAPNGSAAAAPNTRNLLARRYGPATVSIWKARPNGLFSDNQVDESMWA